MTANNKEMDAVVSKAQKLLAKANSLKDMGSVEEAALFAAKVQELLELHKLSMSDLEIDLQDKTEPVGKGEWVLAAGFDRDKHVRYAWVETLADAVARAHFCRILVNANSTKVRFVGRPTDRYIAEWVFGQLTAVGSRLAKLDRGRHRAQVRREYKEQWNVEAPDDYVRRRMKGFRESWQLAFAYTIAKRYQDEERARRAAYDERCTALVVREDAAVAQFMAGFGTISPYAKMKETDTPHGAGYDAGVRAGKAVAIRANVVETAPKPPKQLK